MEGNEKVTRDIFDELFHVDCSGKVEKKNGLNYLSWSWAWAEVRKRYPDADYQIIYNDDNMPYWRDPISEFLEVRTFVTIHGETHPMWLPVMDNMNNPLKFTPYEVTTKSGKRVIQGATMFDINKSLMRCLAKNLAMFGLGLYIYSGEDLPEADENSPEMQVKSVITAIDDVVKGLKDTHTAEEMKAIAATVVKPTIGVTNYKTCTDMDKLNELLEKLKSI